MSLKVPKEWIDQIEKDMHLIMPVSDFVIQGIYFYIVNRHEFEYPMYAYEGLVHMKIRTFKDGRIEIEYNRTYSTPFDDKIEEFVRKVELEEKIHSDVDALRIGKLLLEKFHEGEYW